MKSREDEVLAEYAATVAALRRAFDYTVSAMPPGNKSRAIAVVGRNACSTLEVVLNLMAGSLANETDDPDVN